MKDKSDWKLLIVREDGKQEEQTIKGYARACQEARNERFRADKLKRESGVRIILAREF